MSERQRTSLKTVRSVGSCDRSKRCRKNNHVGKLAGKLKDQGKKVILAAADTFRAAAGEQLTQWATVQE